jgi:hypothetical protein
VATGLPAKVVGRGSTSTGAASGASSDLGLPTLTPDGSGITAAGTRPAIDDDAAGGVGGRTAATRLPGSLTTGALAGTSSVSSGATARADASLTAAAPLGVRLVGATFAAVGGAGTGGAGVSA